MFTKCHHPIQYDGLVETQINGRFVSTISPNNATQTGKTITLLIGNLQPSGAGVYQCRFIDRINGWVLIRNIRLFITGMFVHMVLCISYYIY